MDRRMPGILSRVFLDQAQNYGRIDSAKTIVCLELTHTHSQLVQTPLAFELTSVTEVHNKKN